MDAFASSLAGSFSSSTLPIAYLLTFVCGWALSGAILWMLLKTGWAWALATDVPNHRSLHTKPTPRVGGWGVVPVALTGMLVWAPALRGLAFLGLCLAVISQIDDRRGLPARVRFLAHAMAAVLVVAWVVDAPWWALPAIVVGLIWVMNLYNFMDGADGLAGGMTLFGFGSFAIAAVPSGMPLAGACFTLAGAALGFLTFNFPPARLFLGDAGSVPLGFFVGALALVGWRAGVWNLVFPMLVFSPFLLDASVTLLKRLLRGERFWEAHREHYYQRMIRMDWGRRRVLVLWYVSMFAASALALALSMSSAGVTGWAVGTSVWLLVLLAAGALVDQYWKKFRQQEALGALASGDKDRNV